MRFSGITLRLGCGALLFVVPMAFLLWALLASHGKDIDFATAERQGVEILQGLRPVQAGLARLALGRSEASVADLAARVETTGARLPSLAPETRAASDALRHAGDPPEIALAQAALRRLISAAGDRSNLILDPDLDSYYTTDIVLGKLPDAIDRVAELATASRDGETARVAFYVALGGLTATAAGLDDSVASAVAGNPDHGTQNALGAAATALSRELKAFMAEVEAAPVPAARALPLVDALAAFSAVSQTELNRLLAVRIDRLRAAARTEIVVSAALFLLCATGVLAIVLGGIIRPLGGLTRAMTRLAEGDLAVIVPNEHRRDEIGALARAMAVFKANALAARVTEAARQADQAEKLERQDFVMTLAQDFSAAIGLRLVQMTDATQALSTTAVSLSAQAERTSVEADGVAVNADLALRNAQTVAAATEELSASSHEIGRQMHLAVAQTRAATEQSGTARAVLLGLNEASGAITEVVKLIRSIAAQTNLLALNATIEAARAGEAGRGFAVVAGEVKQLAQETARAVDAVQLRVEAINAGADAVGAAIGRIAGMVEEVSSVASSIADTITQQAAATREITLAVQESANSSSAVAHSIAQVRIGVGVTDAASSTLTLEAVSMADRTGDLNAEVRRFVAEMGQANERRQPDRAPDGQPLPVYEALRDARFG